MEPVASAMARYFQIRELQDGIQIRTGTRTNHRDRLLAAALGATLAGALAKMAILRPWWPVVALAGAIAGFVGLSDKTAVELLMTKSELAWTGYSGKGGRKKIILFTADVRALEFRTGGIASPSGLFALTDSWPRCLLSNIDWNQTTEVIHAIRAKFPGLAEAWHVESPMGKGAGLSRSTTGQ
jgi:hypothetical protein